MLEKLGSAIDDLEDTPVWLPRQRDMSSREYEIGNKQNWVTK